MPLQLIYRPTKLEDVAGNKAVIESIKAIMGRKEDFPHSFLFSGPFGCGKTTLARIIANILGSEDVVEMNMSNMTGIDNVRHIEEICMFPPVLGNCRVYILDEIHFLTKNAQNAFLKLLEEPPSHAYFILCTTDPQQLIPTIISRCHNFQVSTLDYNDMEALLQKILREEGVDDYPKELTDEIIRLAEGHPRDAIKMLDSIIDIVDSETAMKALVATYSIKSDTMQLFRDILDKKEWKLVRKQLPVLFKDNPAERVRQGLHTYMKKVLWNNDAGPAADRAADIIAMTPACLQNPESALVQQLYILSIN